MGELHLTWVTFSGLLTAQALDLRVRVGESRNLRTNVG